MFFFEPEPLSGPRRCRFLQDRSALGPPCISMPRAQRGQSSLPVPDGTPDPTNLRAWIDSGSTRGFYGAVLDWRRLQCFQSLWDHDVKWELFTDYAGRCPRPCGPQVHVRRKKYKPYCRGH